MKKTIVEIYALAVCFFTVACFVIVAGMTVWDTIEMTAPEFTINNVDYEAHLNDESYRKWLIQRNQYRAENYTPPERKALSKSREESWARELRAEQRGALQSLVKNIIVLIIALLAFVAHWKLAQGSRESHS